MTAKVSSALTSDIEKLRGWLPIDAEVKDGRPGLLWMDLRGVLFEEPFLHQTIERVKRDNAQTPERFTEFDVLLRLEKTIQPLNPTGFIFHSSRCGSTLVANACRVLADSVVVSEPYAVDKIVGRLFTDTKDSNTKELLYSLLVRSAVNVLGQRRRETDSRYFVKFSSISALQLKRLTKIWPNVPAVFIYRHPVEVMSSNLADPPAWMDLDSNRTMAAAILGVSESEVGDVSREVFCARALNRFFCAAADSMTSTLRLFNYSELSADSLIKLIKFFGVTPKAAERERITATLKSHAKDPLGMRAFTADSEFKRASASPAIWAAAKQWAMDSYNRLEEIRKGSVDQ
jgi:hypothetical protein